MLFAALVVFLTGRKSVQLQADTYILVRPLELILLASGAIENGFSPHAYDRPPEGRFRGRFLRGFAECNQARPRESLNGPLERALVKTLHEMLGPQIECRSRSMAFKTDTSGVVARFPEALPNQCAEYSREILPLTTCVEVARATKKVLRARAISTSLGLPRTPAPTLKATSSRGAVRISSVADPYAIRPRGLNTSRLGRYDSLIGGPPCRVPPRPLVGAVSPSATPPGSVSALCGHPQEPPAHLTAR